MPSASDFLLRKRKSPKSAHRGFGPYVPRGEPERGVFVNIPAIWYRPVLLLFPATGPDWSKILRWKRLTIAPGYANLRAGVVNRVYRPESGSHPFRRNGTAQIFTGFSYIKAGRPSHNASDHLLRISRIVAPTKRTKLSRKIWGSQGEKKCEPASIFSP